MGDSRVLFEFAYTSRSALLHIRWCFRFYLSSSVAFIANLDEFRRVFRLALKCQSKRKCSLLVCVFGFEEICVHTQSYRTFSLFIFLQHMIFGPTFNRMWSDEIVYKKKNTTILHIRSEKRMAELFIVRDFRFSVLLDGEYQYYIFQRCFPITLLDTPWVMNGWGRLGAYKWRIVYL